MRSTGEVTRLSSLKQARSLRTRSKLVDAASRLWRQRGFDETSVEDVCNKAGVAKGTFFFYFRAKEDLLIELGLDAAEGMAEAGDSAIAAGQSTPQVLDKALLGLAARAKRTPKPLLERSMEEVFHSVGARWREAKARTGHRHFRGILLDIFARGQDRGEVDRRHDADEVAGIMSLVVLQALFDWSRDQSDAPGLVQILRRRSKLVLKDVFVAADRN